VSSREEDISGNLDWVAVLLYIIMVGMGWLNIYASVYDESVNQTIWDLSLNSGRQLIFIAASVIIILAIVVIDMRFYETFAYLFYGIIIFALILRGLQLVHSASNLLSLQNSLQQ
jgi:rod shape determining protein RodA